MMEATRPITEFSGEYWFLSNLYSVPLTHEGLTYPCAENAIQATKLSSKWDRIPLTKCTSAQIPGLLKEAGVNPSWRLMRFSLMESVLRAKFESPELSFRLRSTGRARILAPHRLVGTFWGYHAAHNSNFFGKILMLIRDSAAPVPRPMIAPLRIEDGVLSRHCTIINYPTSALSGIATEQMMGRVGFKYDPNETFRRVVVLGEWVLSNGMRVIATATTPEMVLVWISTKSRSIAEMKALVPGRLEALRGSLPPGTKAPHIRMSRRGVQVQGKFTQDIWSDLERYGAHIDNINLTHSELSFVLLLGEGQCEVYKPTADTLAELSQDACFSKFALCTSSRLQYTGSVHSAGAIMSNLLRILNDVIVQHARLVVPGYTERIL